MAKNSVNIISLPHVRTHRSRHITSTRQFVASLIQRESGANPSPATGQRALAVAAVVGAAVEEATAAAHSRAQGSYIHRAEWAEEASPPGPKMSDSQA